MYFRVMKVIHFPLARITIAFVLGLLLAYYIKIPISIVFSILILLSILLIFIFYTYKNKQTTIFSFLTYLVSFIVGISNQIIHTDYYQKNNYIHDSSLFEKTHSINITIREKLKSSSFSNRYIAIVNEIDQKAKSGRILLNIQKDSIDHDVEIGSNLLLKGKLSRNKSADNPNQFDFSKYLENKQIYAQIYSHADDIKKGSKIQKSIWYYSSKLRARIIKNLQKNNFNKTELNVALALIMGQRQEIAPEILRDYQYAGAIHILSVSGLHIGFVLLFVSFILKPFPNTRKASLIKLIIIIISLSLFGIIAGLAPSVIRSVTMFSFVAIGNHLRRSVNIYHTLLVSILLILLFQPSFLFDVGFQLSYIAVFFIVWLQPLFSSLWTPKKRFFKYMWSILTVTFAAQIGTLPITIYYFHQFPGLFFVTNLIIIPLLSIIMVLGIVVMILAAFNSIPLFLSNLLQWSIFCLNKIINTIASFEQFIIKDIPLHFYMLVSGYLFIITLIIWFKKPNFTRLVTVMLSIIIIQLCFFKTHLNAIKEKELIVFSVKKSTLVAETIGNKTTIYTKKEGLINVSNNNILKSYCSSNFSSIKNNKELKNFLYFNNKRILILDSTNLSAHNTHPDLLLLTQSPKINLDRILINSKPKMVIADGSNFNTVLKRWKESCRKQKIPFHSTNEKGFYILK
ncbi:ComEC/Rec2 family competence protein [Flavobacterium flabelliforme]|nr:ComEC/Rec2 family competence protein [Flavobacterium flabelliforme]